MVTSRAKNTDARRLAVNAKESILLEGTIGTTVVNSDYFLITSACLKHQAILGKFDVTQTNIRVLCVIDLPEMLYPIRASVSSICFYAYSSSGNIYQVDLDGSLSFIGCIVRPNSSRLDSFYVLEDGDMETFVARYDNRIYVLQRGAKAVHEIDLMKYHQRSAGDDFGLIHDVGRKQIISYVSHGQVLCFWAVEDLIQGRPKATHSIGWNMINHASVNSCKRDGHLIFVGGTQEKQKSILMRGDGEVLKIYRFPCLYNALISPSSLWVYADDLECTRLISTTGCLPTQRLGKLNWNDNYYYAEWLSSGDYEHEYLMQTVSIGLSQPQHRHVLYQHGKKYWTIKNLKSPLSWRLVSDDYAIVTNDSYLWAVNILHRKFVNCVRLSPLKPEDITPDLFDIPF